MLSYLVNRHQRVQPTVTDYGQTREDIFLSMRLRQSPCLRTVKRKFLVTHDSLWDCAVLMLQNMYTCLVCDFEIPDCSQYWSITCEKMKLWISVGVLAIGNACMIIRQVHFYHFHIGCCHQHKPDKCMSCAYLPFVFYTCEQKSVECKLLQSLKLIHSVFLKQGVP